MKRTITEQITSFDKYDLEGPVDEAIKNLTDLRDSLATSHTNIRIRVDIYHSYEDAYAVIEAWADREETDAEEKARERKEAIDKRNDEWREKELLRKLKEKYKE